MIRFNSTTDEFVGYTEYGAKWADELNNKTEWLHQQAVIDVANCKSVGAHYLPYTEKTGEIQFLLLL